MKPKKFNTFSIAGNGKMNEDYILCQDLSEEWSLAILADGMGGLLYALIPQHYNLTLFISS